MADNSDPEGRVGWEPIYRSGLILERYGSFAVPNQAVVEWADTLKPGAFILDLGCGAGRHLIYLGERGFHIAGMDVAPTGVRMAQDACASRQLSADIRTSNMTTIPWADETFDAVLSTSVIHHQLREGMVQTLDEIRRVLKPGGHFLADFISTARADYRDMRRLVADGDIVEVEANTFVDERPDTEDLDGFLPHHYSDEADVRDLLHAFEIIRLEHDSQDLGLVPQTWNRGNWVAWADKPL